MNPREQGDLGDTVRRRVAVVAGLPGLRAVRPQPGHRSRRRHRRSRGAGAGQDVGSLPSTVAGASPSVHAAATRAGTGSSSASGASAATTCSCWSAMAGAGSSRHRSSRARPRSLSEARSTPSTRSIRGGRLPRPRYTPRRLGGIPKRSNGMRCKRIGSAFAGSNPAPATLRRAPRNFVRRSRFNAAWTRAFRSPPAPVPVGRCHVPTARTGGGEEAVSPHDGTAAGPLWLPCRAMSRRPLALTLTAALALRRRRLRLEQRQQLVHVVFGLHRSVEHPGCPGHRASRGPSRRSRCRAASRPKKLVVKDLIPGTGPGREGRRPDHGQLHRRQLQRRQDVRQLL